MTQENTQEVPKRTKVELVEAMQKIFTEIGSLQEDVDAIKEEAKERSMPAALMAKCAKAMADAKCDDIIDKNQDFAALVDEVRNN